jgi:hypothetical protein
VSRLRVHFLKIGDLKTWKKKYVIKL